MKFEIKELSKQEQKELCIGKYTVKYENFTMGCGSKKQVIDTVKEILAESATPSKLCIENGYAVLKFKLSKYELDQLLPFVSK